MKTTIIAVIGDAFNGTSTDTGCCDVSVAGAENLFLGRGEAGGWTFGFIYAYTCAAADAAAVEAELVSGGASVIGKVTGATNAFVERMVAA